MHPDRVGKDSLARRKEINHIESSKLKSEMGITTNIPLEDAVT